MLRYGEFLTSEEDRMFVEAIRRYIDQEVMPVRTELDTDYSVFERIYQGLAEMGIQRRGFAERYGGLAIRSAVTVCAITEEIARGDSGLALHTLLVPWGMANTRLRRCIQLIGASGWSASMCLGRCGTICLRCLKLGANTP